MKTPSRFACSAAFASAVRSMLRSRKSIGRAISAIPAPIKSGAAFLQEPK
jgi:hypothetical protein